MTKFGGVDLSPAGFFVENCEDLSDHNTKTGF